MKLEYVDKDDDYYYYNHPVMGKIGIRQDVADAEGNKSDVMNRKLVDAYSKHLEDNEQVPDNYDAFSSLWSREAGITDSSTVRGIEEMVTGERTTTYEQDFIDEVYLKTNPWSAWSGLLSGAVMDAPSYLNPYGKLLKLGKFGKMAYLGATGGTAGFIAPVREEFGESRAMNAAIGAGGTMAIGGALSLLARKMGYSDAPALQKAHDEASTETRVEIEEEINRIAEELGINPKQKDAEEIAKYQEDYNQALARIQAENAPANLADEEADIMARLADRRERDAIADEFNTRLAKIQNDPAIAEAEKRSIREEFEQRLAQIQQPRPDIDFKAQTRVNIEEAQNPQAIADRVRSGMLSELETQMKSTLTFTSGRAVQDTIKTLRGQLKNVDSALKRLGEGKAVKLTEQQLRLRQSKLREQIADKTIERDAVKAREKATADYVKLKKGDTTPEYNKRLRDALSTAPKMDALPVPPKAVMDDIRAVSSVQPRKNGTTDIKTVTDRDGIIKVPETLKGLPPVPPNHVRMYRGWSPTVSFKDVFNAKGLEQYARPEGMKGDRYSDSIEYADYFRDSFNKNKDARISYIDVPESYLPSKKVSDNEYLIDVDEVMGMRSPKTKLVPDEATMSDIQRVTSQAMPPSQMTMPARQMPEAVSRFAEPRMSPIPEGQVPFPTVRQQNPSVGAMGDNLGRQPSAIRNVLMMNTTSKAAQDLPRPRGQQANDLTEPQAIRQAAMQKYEGESGIADRAFGFETENGVFSNAAMDAEYNAALRAAESAVRDGEVSSVLEYIGRRAAEGNNIDLTVGEIQLLQRQAPYVMKAMEELSTKIRSMERTKTVDDMEALYKAQSLSRLYAAFDEMRGIQMLTEGSKARISAIMRSFQRTNEMAIEEIRALRQGRKVNQIYLGLEC